MCPRLDLPVMLLYWRLVGRVPRLLKETQGAVSGRCGSRFPQGRGVAQPSREITDKGIVPRDLAIQGILPTGQPEATSPVPIRS